MRKTFYSFILYLFAATLLCAHFYNASASEMSKEEAVEILRDTITITYNSLPDESRFDNSDNVIKAALFGAFEAKANFKSKMLPAKEKGQTVTQSNVLFQVGEEIFYADQVTTQSESPEIFRNIPKPENAPDYYTDFISKRAVELAALRYTGHKITKHSAPKNMWLNDKGYFNYFSHMQSYINPHILINEKGYLIIIEEIGIKMTFKLMEVIPKNDGYVINALLTQYDYNHSNNEPESIVVKLELIPGDVAGTWKRKAFTAKRPNN